MLVRSVYVSRILAVSFFLTGGLVQANSTCIDTGTIGDGWGWNGSSSCVVQVEPTTDTTSPNNTACVDTDPVGDGWGWDGSSSCQVGTAESTAQSDNNNPSAAACIDTAPIGDGWGWDGSSSCQVGGSASSIISTDNNANVSACVDTPPLGDGWGWDGSSSCQVGGTTNSIVSNDDNTNASACVDTPPLGDGWGWDGVGSCTLEVAVITADPDPVSEPDSQPEPTPEPPAPTPETTTSSKPVSGVDIPGYIARETSSGAVFFATDLLQRNNTLYLTLAIDNRTGSQIDRVSCRPSLLSGSTIVDSGIAIFENVESNEVLFDRAIFFDISLSDFDSIQLGCDGVAFGNAQEIVPDPPSELSVVTSDDHRGVSFFYTGTNTSGFASIGTVVLLNTTNTTVERASCRTFYVNDFGYVEDGIAIFENVGSGQRKFEEALALSIDSLLDFDFVQLRCDSVRFQGE